MLKHKAELNVMEIAFEFYRTSSANRRSEMNLR
jgi:hypothetical protein